MGNEIERLLFDNFICPPTAILRREAWEEIGFKYDEHTPFGEDWWVWLRVGLRRPFYYLNDVVGYYRVHADNIRRGLLASCKAESSIKYILDHFFAIPGLPASIVRLKRQVYAQQYRRLADIYFGIGLYFDCRRCLRMSIRWNGLFVFNVQWWRRYLLATLPAEVYRYLKAVRKKIV